MKRLALLLVLAIAFSGWVTPTTATQPLTSETPVVGVWRDSTGKQVGTYQTTLGQLNNVGMQVTSLESRLNDVEELIHAIVTDPEMRGHLMRHDMTRQELDDIARKFDRK